MNRWLLAGLCTLGLVAAQSSASAQTYISPVFGYGIELEDETLNPFGFALGGRAGDTFPSKLYFGGSAVFYFGQKETAAGVETGIRTLQLGPELGYDVEFSAFVLRPYVGLGANLQFVTVRGEAFGVETKDSELKLDLFLDAGFILLCSLTQTQFIGIDVRSTNVMADAKTINGVVFLATVGTRL